MRRKASIGTRTDTKRARSPRAADGKDGLAALCEEWIALLRRRRASPARIRKAATRLRALARDVRASKRPIPSEEELREIAAVLAEISPRGKQASVGEDDAAVAHRGLLAWTESAKSDDWSMFYPPSLRKVRKAQ